MDTRDTHRLHPIVPVSETLGWLRAYGYTGVPVDATPSSPAGVLFRPVNSPNEAPKLAAVGDTLIADGHTVKIADPFFQEGTRT